MEFIKSLKKSEQELNALKSRVLVDFYREQNQTIEAIESVDVPFLRDDQGRLMIETVKRFISGDRSIEFEAYTLGVLGSGICVKVFMFIYCRFIAKRTSNVRVLAKDHFNDVVANSGALAFGALGRYWIWEFDPVGCLCISAYLMYTWVREGTRTIQMLAGYRAGNQLMKKWTYVCLKHHPRIKQIDTVRAYHLSLGFIVEVDIVLPSDMTIMEAHDIGETLQIKLESFKEVERAFVHIDYSSDHKPEH
ncbi:uncharacterized protein LOC126320005 [Schistocerca gregaria]|uniref:uncharacterized protein LOC126320005 n=1 Tax=Schistocerca gregaria TaxID=7010 RepID=UPI00211EF0DE|nr:uncharacterized protein LOC126320005 [Schistocerca gregaria]